MFNTHNSFETAILMLAIVGYMVYRLLARRPVTRRDLIIPVIAALYLADKDVDWTNATLASAVVAGAILGLLAGAVSGQLVRVWRAEDGQVYQCGSWRYAAVLVGLLVVRIALYAVFVRGAHGATALALGDAFTAMAIGLYLGRTVSVGARALALLGWHSDALPRTGLMSR